jgi:calcineurin-like phosphoesterase
MVGVSNGILGMDRGPIVNRFLTQLPVRFEALEKGPVMICAIKVVIDVEQGRAISVERIQKEYSL